MQTTARIGRADARSLPAPAPVTEEGVRGYLAALASKGRARGTVGMYAARLKALWSYLPPDKLIYPDTLARWQEALLEHGYSASTVNTHLSAANGLLDYMGRRDLQLSGRLEVAKAARPELTRREYLRLLRAAKALDRERTYLLTKTFALTGIQTVDLDRVTVEAVKAGRLPTASEGEQGTAPIPRCLRQELTDYIARQGILSGPVFLTKNRKTILRTQVTAEIQALGRDARVDEAKCNPRSLRKLYLGTQAEIERAVRALAERSYEQLLDTEQLAIGWGDI